MKRFLFLSLLIFSIFLPAPPYLSAEEILAEENPPVERLEFRDQPLADVLTALGAAGGKTILTDETITGRTSCRFTETTLPEALQLLSRKHGLFFDQSDDGFIEVSRISLEYNGEEDFLRLNSSGSDPALLLEKLSRTTGKTILHDPLPTRAFPIHCENISLGDFLAMFILKFPEYRLDTDENYFNIRKNPFLSDEAVTQESAETVTLDESGKRYTLRMERGDLFSVLEELFQKGDREYALLYKSPAALKNLNYRNREFDELLKLLLLQGGGDFTIHQGTYYIYDIGRQDILKSFKTTEYIPLNYLSAEQLPALLPPSLSSTTFYRIDKVRNGIILSGSREEINPIRNYIITLDMPMEGREYRRVRMDYMEASKFIDLLPLRLVTPGPLINPDGHSFLSFLTEDQYNELRTLKMALDVPVQTEVLTFRYIKAEEFLNNIPPPFDSADFTATGNAASVYFSGSDGKRSHLGEILEKVDRPTAQIRYKMLIIQYQQGAGIDHGLSLAVNPEQDNSETAFLGTLGSLLSLNFDIISTFGYLFSLDLDYSLNTSKAHILADTTLYGLSGEAVKFQNSSTYRYQEQEVDEDGDVTATGVTQEISTGLFMDITGWVSGDDMITMEVASTLSKTSTSSNSDDSSLPGTSERVVKTHIRTPSGKPIIIGGLMQTEQTVKKEKTPILGDIPLLGLLFQRNKMTEENTELVIYIVPYLDKGQQTERVPEEEFDRLFDLFFPGDAE